MSLTFNIHKNMKRFLLLFFVFATIANGADRPKAASGFTWKSYELCDIQIPAGWHVLPTNAGATQVIRISPEPLKNGKAMATGFTMNMVKAKTPQQWNEAMKMVGTVMSDIREATPNPIQSSIQDEKDMLLMIIEGERLIPTAPNPEKKYHVRTIVRAFPQYATVYIYSFGAPVDEWEKAWKTGTVMLNPIWFHLSK